jgi:hypothetical protein
VKIAYFRDFRDAKRCLHYLFRRDTFPKSLSVKNVQFLLIYSLRIDLGSIEQKLSPNLVREKSGSNKKNILRIYFN